MTILATVGSWNEFLHPLIAANRNELRTLPVGLAQLRGAFGESQPWNTIMMGTVLMTRADGDRLLRVPALLPPGARPAPSRGRQHADAELIELALGDR